MLTQLHIEAARNSTDDFNLFHDKHRWNMLPSNPFGGPIALGFQLACFIEDEVAKWREENASANTSLIDELNFSTYEFAFAGVVKAGDSLNLIVRGAKTQENEKGRLYSNRLALKTQHSTALVGTKKDSNYPLVEPGVVIPPEHELAFYEDRSFYKSDVFVKRKYMIVGNAKNFLSSAFVEQSKYIDEFDDKVQFPETYPLSLMSSALLERAQSTGVDLLKNPMIYTSQKMCIDKGKLRLLQSNDRLTILVSQDKQPEGSGKSRFECTGLVDGQGVLFNAEMCLTPLSALA